jgi:hypothetical protein
MERLDLDADVLEAARNLARSQNRSLAQVVSDMARRGAAAWPDDVTIVNNVSELSSFPPDPSRYPLFAQASYATITLEPGDLLYIPRRWWFWEISFGRNLALGFWHAADRLTASVPGDHDRFAQIDSIGDTAVFRGYFERKRPVAVRAGEVKSWPAFEGWTDEYLREAAGGRQFFVGVSPDPDLHATRGNHRTRVEAMSLGQFLERGSESPEYHYLAQNDTIPRLRRADWALPEFWKGCFEDEAFRVPFWFCFGRDVGITAPLHFDYYENLLAQLAGTKRILLFSPAETPYLYRKEQQLLTP